MSDFFTADEIRSNFNTLRAYLRDLVEASFEQFSTKLRLFVNYCEKDEVVRVIARSLHGRAGDVKAWFTSVAAGGAADLPKAASARLAHYFMTLSELKRQGLEVRQLVSTMYGSRGGFKESYAAFQSEFLAPFAQDLLARLGRIEAALPGDGNGRVDLDAAFAGALEERAAAEPGKPPIESKPGAAAAAATAAAAAAVERVDDLVKALGASVKKAKEIVAERRKDLETDLKILQLELSKQQPNKDVLLAVVRPLERLGGEVAAAATTLGARLAAAGSDLAASVAKTAGAKKKK
jgi:hypothetical protein